MTESSYEAIFYVRPSGRCSMDEFPDGLPVKARAKLMKWLEKLEELGPDLPRPYAVVVHGKIRSFA